MPAVIAATCLLAACMCIAFGVVRIATWLIDRREQDRARVIRDAAFVAQVRAELAQRNARDLTDVARAERLSCSLRAGVAASGGAAWLI